MEKLNYQLSSEEIISQLDSNIKTGLSEAEVLKRKRNLWT